jgi:hypothetical protein
MAKPVSTIPASRLAAYERLVATKPAVERKGATMPYTSQNGHMFSFLTGDGGLVLRLPAAERAAFIDKYKTRLHVAHGRVMQEFVEVPDALFDKLAALQPYFALSCRYVRALPAKPAAKRTAAKPAVTRTGASKTRKTVAKRR